MRIVVSLIGLLLIPSVAWTQPGAAEFPKKFDLAAIDAHLATEIGPKKFVGLSLAIMREGKIIFAKGYGKRSLEPEKPVEEATSFGVGSITKQFTCACIFLLEEDGKLSVRDPVAKYFPDLTRAKDITLLDLMNHVAGYPDYYPLDFVDRRMMKPIPTAQLLKEYAGGKLDFEPGSRFSYSNTGYILLGAIVEKLSGETFAKFLEKRILKPLRMENSRFGTTKGLANSATGYTSFALGAPEASVEEAAGWIDAAGGLWASASDLLRWDLALVEGKVLKPASYKLFTASRELSNGKISDYACGLGIARLNGETILRHSGAVSGFLAYNAFAPRTKSGVVLLANTDHVSPSALHGKILNLLMKDIDDREAPEVPKINGPEPKEVVLDFLHQMQAGKVNRAKLGDEFSHYLDDERIKTGGARLKELGEPEKMEVNRTAERGGMEVASVKLTFKKAVLRGSLYRTPDGKIQQLLFYNE